MSDSIKTVIINVASKNGDYIKKHLKISHQKILIQELTMIKLLQHKENSYNTVSLRRIDVSNTPNKTLLKLLT